VSVVILKMEDEKHALLHPSDELPESPLPSAPNYSLPSQPMNSPVPIGSYPSQPGYQPVEQPGYQLVQQAGYQPAPTNFYPPQPDYLPAPAAHSPQQSNYAPLNGGETQSPPRTDIMIVASSPIARVEYTIFLGPVPVPVNCPNCHRSVMTRVAYTAGAMTYTWCLVLWCFAGPFCFIPFFCEECKDAKHYCPMCSHFIGTKTAC
jgi:hypothetical protein